MKLVTKLNLTVPDNVVFKKVAIKCGKYIILLNKYIKKIYQIRLAFFIV